MRNPSFIAYLRYRTLIRILNQIEEMSQESITATSQVSTAASQEPTPSPGAIGDGRPSGSVSISQLAVPDAEIEKLSISSLEATEPDNLNSTSGLIPQQSWSWPYHPARNGPIDFFQTVETSCGPLPVSKDPKCSPLWRAMRAATMQPDRDGWPRPTPEHFPVNNDLLRLFNRPSASTGVRNIANDDDERWGPIGSPKGKGKEVVRFGNHGNGEGPNITGNLTNGEAESSTFQFGNTPRKTDFKGKGRKRGISMIN